MRLFQKKSQCFFELLLLLPDLLPADLGVLKSDSGFTKDGYSVNGSGLFVSLQNAKID